MLNGKQQSIFQPLKEAAWLAYCGRNPLVDPKHKGSMTDWYRKVLTQELGVWTTKELSEHDQDKFDALCLVFATIAGNQKEIEYWSSAAERRALWRLKQTMKNAGVDLAYVRGIMRNMNMGDKAIEDLPAELILKINTAVFIYMKRRSKSRPLKESGSPISVHPHSSAANSSLEDPSLSFP